MQIHHYHPDTGAYLGQGTADTDPLEPGRWLIPAQATTDTPPQVPEGKDLFNLGGSWVLRDQPAPDAADIERLASLEAEAASLRAEMVGLGA